MKHSAIMLAGVTLVLAATPLSAGEPGGRALPLPTGMTAVTPKIPSPVIQEGMPTAGTAGRNRWHDLFGGFSLFSSTSQDNCEPYDPVRFKPQWCLQCAPAVRHPLPPLPPGIVTTAHCERTRPAPRTEPACRDHGGSCWEKYKAWRCFRLTPVHLPCTPTPRYAPLYTYFPCREHAGAIGGGCDISRPGLRHSAGLHTGRTMASTCTVCPAPGEAILPGYRLATPRVTAPVLVSGGLQEAK